MDVDQFVADHPDFVVVTSVGDQGQAAVGSTVTPPPGSPPPPTGVLCCTHCAVCLPPMFVRLPTQHRVPAAPPLRGLCPPFVMVAGKTPYTAPRAVCLHSTSAGSLSSGLAETACAGDEPRDMQELRQRRLQRLRQPAVQATRRRSARDSTVGVLQAWARVGMGDSSASTSSTGNLQLFRARQQYARASDRDYQAYRDGQLSVNRQCRHTARASDGRRSSMQSARSLLAPCLDDERNRGSEQSSPPLPTSTSRSLQAS